MKKAVSIILALILLILTVTATVNAEIVNPEALRFTEDAIAQAEAEAGTSIPTSRIYFKMPAEDYWYSDYSVYQGKYYAGVYWWGSDSVNPEAYPGYRASIDDYEQGIYYAEIPDGVAFAIWNNGFAATQAESETPKYQQMRHSADLYVEGAWEGEFDTLPEGSPNQENMDGCIFVYDPDSAIGQMDAHPELNYYFQPYIYYGNGCYGSYATTSENFVSIEDNCLNPDHFDEQGSHIGGAHIKAPVSPENPPYDTAPDSEINGWYFVSDREPNVVRSENKLYQSTVEGEYYRYRHISQNTRFKIVHYMDGKAISDCEQFPAQGWYNENGEFNNYPSGMDYTVYFRPDGSGDSSFIDGTIKAVPYEQMPTELPTESASAEPPYLYKARFEQIYSNDDGWYGWYDYKELYYHTGQNGETDWALVYAMLPMSSPIELYTIVGNRVVHPGNQYEPFDACYGIYDVKEDKFIDAASSAANRYPDFLQVFDEIGTGRLIGDIDRDDEISILDATLLQRCAAGMRGYPEDDTFYITYEWGKSRFYSDFNRDGERDVLDATCIQRYLAGLPYTIG